jgi:predicted transposase/invertase (TIGR01784 family)
MATPVINYADLMDLRIDYAFKTFAEDNPNSLISLLNAIFANKKIKRVIKSILIKNPNMDKKSMEDKLSILDIRAELDDGTDILIEMHLHGLGQIKAKIIRSWARAHSEELEPGQRYTSQPPTIAIAFVDGAVEPIEKPKDATDKIHNVYMIMNKEDNTVLTDAMELHFINMKAFANAVNEADSINIQEATDDMFAYWLSVITEKDIVNKEIIENARKEKEEIQMAVSAIARQSEDKLIRQAYLRRQDEIYFNNLERQEDRQLLEEYKRSAEKALRRATQAERIITQEKTRAEQAEAEISRLRHVEAELEKLRQQLAASTS